ncbi:DEAD/DEAH box helicase [Roseimaritima sediminicola]|uniref:DEAD/DEAH box helicase n=1 Tax=Roseimaritima sediminicola TaxID=2662066 RepID=UPI001298305F|nr:DEAD/DEAH box helicase [Roseimaritima sediminicola]
MKYDLRKWQKEALALWADAGCRGIFKVVTGGGKTVFSQACIQFALENWPDLRVFIVVPTVSLADQWAVSLTEEGGIPKSEITVYRRKQKTRTRFVVIVINTARTIMTDLADSARDNMLVVDECHRAGSDQNAKALGGEFVATVGLSATPERPYDDNLEDRIVPRLGKVLYEYGLAEARKDGVISEFDLVNVNVPLTRPEQTEYRRVSQLIGHRSKQLSGCSPAERQADARLNSLLRRRASIANNAAMRTATTIRLIEQHRSKKCIVFHESVTAINKMLAIAQERGHSATIYHTGIDGEYRRENLRLFRTGVFDVLFSCKALDEGMNVPEVEIAVIAAATATQRQRIQRLGRVLRPAKHKDRATVYTLYSTDAEETRLVGEAANLADIARVRWIGVSTQDEQRKDSRK